VEFVSGVLQAWYGVFLLCSSAFALMDAGRLTSIPLGLGASPRQLLTQARALFNSDG
jgi:hypothetical protein